jgi:desulfoferrodoxin-like iron-binding protein
MAEILQIYKCTVCGIAVEVIKGGFGILECCRVEMKLIEDPNKTAGLKITD